MDIQEQLNTAFIADDDDFLEELEFSSIEQHEKESNSTTISKMDIQEQLNTAFIADDSDFLHFSELSLIDQLFSADDTQE